MSESDKTSPSAGAKPRLTVQEARALMAVRRNEARRHGPTEDVVLSMYEANEIIRALFVKSDKAAEEFSTALGKVNPREA